MRAARPQGKYLKVGTATVNDPSVESAPACDHAPVKSARASLGCSNPTLAALGGFSDWRLPTLVELVELHSVRRLKPVAELAASKPHGTRIRYLGGCKCLRCRMANANYEAGRKKARQAGDWNGIVSADAARMHILKLSRRGVGYKLVADAAGVSRNVVKAIRSGERAQARARTVRKILQVTTACRGDASLVSARKTWRYINALLEEGYTKGQIAVLLGRKTKALQINKDRVTARTASDVAALYRKLTT